jgi:hypothetical protein
MMSDTNKKYKYFARQSLPMPRPAVIGCLFLALLLCSFVVPNASAVTTHSTNIVGTTPPGNHDQYRYINATVPNGATVTYSFGPNNYYYSVGYKDIWNTNLILKNDIRSHTPGDHKYCNGTFVANNGTGMYRFWVYNMDSITLPTPGVPYLISYTSPDSGSVVRLVNVQNSVPYVYDLNYANDTYYGHFYTSPGSSVDGIQASFFLPDLTGTVKWRSNVSYYDGASLLHTYAFPQVNSSGFCEMTIGTYADAGPIWKAKVDVTTASNRIYYFNADFMAYNATTGTYVTGYHVTITIREQTPITAQVNWINGILWMMIMFLPAWLLNWVFPRYGLILGLALMSIVLGFTQSDAMWVSFLSFLVLGSMLFTMRGD